MLVCFDATVLCGALRKPTGHNFKLLRLAAEGVALRGFTTDVAGFEFVRNAVGPGLGGVVYPYDLVEAFLDSFTPLFDPDNVAQAPIGRRLASLTWLHDRPVGEVVYHLTGRTHDELLHDLQSQIRVTAGELDPFDLHLVAAAVQRNADLICSANTRHLPEGELVGGVEVIRPGRLAAELAVL